MTPLEYFEKKIQSRQEKISFREFFMRVACWRSFTLYRTDGMIARAPKNDRITFERSADTQTVSQSKTYDHERSFFEQLKDLYLSLKHPPIKHFLENENAGYTDTAFGVKNGYLCFECGESVENIAYSILILKNCRNILDSSLITTSENIVRSTGVGASYNIFYSFGIQSSSNLWFCSNCIGCEECLFSSDLINQKYTIRGIVYPKDEYFRLKNEILSRPSEYATLSHSLTRSPPNVGNIASVGTGLKHCEHVYQGYYSTGVKYGKNIVNAEDPNGPLTRAMNCFSIAGSGDLYGCCGAGLDGGRYYFANESGLGTHLYYSSQMEGCSFCLGCIGLKNVSYCILNVQYSQDDWNREVLCIFGQMEQDGTLGEFWPAEICPYPLNDTAAGMMGKYSREEVLAAGYLWRDEPLSVNIPESSVSITIDQISQYETWGVGSEGQRTLVIDPQILKTIIIDPTGNPYTITEFERDLLQKFAIPLPRNHWQDRMRQSLDILPKDIF